MITTLTGGGPNYRAIWMLTLVSRVIMFISRAGCSWRCTGPTMRMSEDLLIGTRLVKGGGLNLYDYVGNDPIRYYDPLGLAIGDWWDPRTWFNGGFTESWSDESSSIVNTWGDIVTGNWGDIGNNYDNSSLGQSESIGGGVGTGEKICLGTAVAATTAAIALMVAEAAGIGAPPEDYIPPPKPDGSGPPLPPGLDPSAGRPPLPNPTPPIPPGDPWIDGGVAWTLLLELAQISKYD